MISYSAVLGDSNRISLTRHIRKSETSVSQNYHWWFNVKYDGQISWCTMRAYSVGVDLIYSSLWEVPRGSNWHAPVRCLAQCFHPSLSFGAFLPKGHKKEQCLHSPEFGSCSWARLLPRPLCVPPFQHTHIRAIHNLFFNAHLLDSKHKSYQKISQLIMLEERCWNLRNHHFGQQSFQNVRKVSVTKETTLHLINAYNSL